MGCIRRPAAKYSKSPKGEAVERLSHEILIFISCFVAELHVMMIETAT